jgi:uncharacterized protein with von Willebrand factor type A (vWA) domain
MADLASATLEFTTLLREEHDFVLGRAELHDALRATEAIGVRERTRLRAALRAVCCSSPREIETFDSVFDAFFSSGPTGVPQPKHARRSRPDGSGEPPPERQSSYRLEDESAAERWQNLRARYSPIESAAPPPPISRDGYDEADALVRRLIVRLRLGRARRLRPQPRGPKLDLRRTLRTSTQTGGEIMTLRRRGHPLRNPRFVVLIDASRSMSEHAPAALQVAHALCRRTLRASAFVFSTSLREITRDLRRNRVGDALAEIGDAWGGGTRIGSSLNAFVRNFSSRLDDHTLVIVVSDGLDVGDLDQLEHAMREISRRSAAVAWVNPHAAEPGFTPVSRGMQTALPYLSSLSSWSGLADA